MRYILYLLVFYQYNNVRFYLCECSYFFKLKPPKCAYRTIAHLNHTSAFWTIISPRGGDITHYGNNCTSPNVPIHKMLRNLLKKLSNKYNESN